MVSYITQGYPRLTIISVTRGYYPSPGIDFEVLGGKMEGLGLTPVGVGFGRKVGGNVAINCGNNWYFWPLK